MYQNSNQQQDPYAGFGPPPNYDTRPDQQQDPYASFEPPSNYGTRPNYQQQNLSRPRCWYGNVRRVIYGSLWSFYTVIFAFAFFHFLSTGLSMTTLIIGGLALLMGNYAYRIWTWRARHLWLIIFF